MAEQVSSTLSESCLCGGIRIEIAGSSFDIVHCHCSLCRKVSGGASMAVLWVDEAQLIWLSGEDLVAAYERPSGYGSSYCRSCGSPAPDGGYDRTADRRIYGVPAGLLDGHSELRVARHIFVGSKVSWEAIGDDGGSCFDGPPGSWQE